MGERAAWFGELRSVVFGPPSRQRFLALARALDPVDEAYQEQVLVPYLEEHLERWPDEARILPKPWFDEARLGHERAKLKLVRTLLPWGQHTFDDEALEALSQLDALELTVVSLARSQVSALNPLNRWRLRSLNIGACHALTSLTPLKSQRAITTLHAPQLVAIKLEDVASLETLEVLDWSYSALSVKGFEALKALQALKTLRLSCADEQFTAPTLSPLQDATRLETLAINGWRALRDISALAGARALVEIDLEGCASLDVEQAARILAALPMLKRVRADYALTEALARLRA